jgi:hypothetical protein
MKKLAVAILFSLVAVAGAQTLRAPLKKKAVKTQTPPAVPRQKVDGVIPAAFQPGGNPLQMLNPKAPAKYGTAQQHVDIDPRTGKWKGIKLFSITF